MSIDPRILSQLLQLQIQSGVSLFPGKDSQVAGDSTGNEFASLLQSVLAEAQNSNASASPVKGGMTGLPSALRTMRSTIGLPAAQPSAFDPLIAQAGARYGVASGLIKGVIHAESSFNPHAVSSAGAKGLMQLMDGTARSLGVADSYDPEQNINGGTKYLADLLRKYGHNEAVALAAYNAGPGTVDRLGIRTDADFYAKQHLLPSETRSYVPKVLEAKRNFEGS